MVVKPGVSFSISHIYIYAADSKCLSASRGLCVEMGGWGSGQGSVRVFGAGDLDQEGSISLTLTCDIDRPSDLGRTILPWTNNMNMCSGGHS